VAILSNCLCWYPYSTSHLTERATHVLSTSPPHTTHPTLVRGGHKGVTYLLFLNVLHTCYPKVVARICLDMIYNRGPWLSSLPCHQLLSHTQHIPLLSRVGTKALHTCLFLYVLHMCYPKVVARVCLDMIYIRGPWLSSLPCHQLLCHTQHIPLMSGVGTKALHTCLFFKRATHVLSQSSCTHMSGYDL
jgi:hypothetical protein